MGVKIDPLRCTGCGACIYECPVGVLYMDDMKCRVAEGCISCGRCIDICHWQAITPDDEPTEKNGGV